MTTHGRLQLEWRYPCKCERIPSQPEPPSLPTWPPPTPFANCPPGEITRLLNEASVGNRDAFGQVVTLVYGELSVLAHRKIRHELPGHTLNTTGLVHEAYLKLVDQNRAEWKNCEQFFAIAAEAMCRVLVDHARRQNRNKRGGKQEHVSLTEADALDVPAFLGDEQAEELIALDEALQRLAAFNPEGARIVQLRFLGGLSNEEVADMLESSERTVQRSWSVSKAWLRRELGALVHHGSALSSLGVDQ